MHDERLDDDYWRVRVLLRDQIMEKPTCLLIAYIRHMRLFCTHAVCPRAKEEPFTKPAVVHKWARVIYHTFNELCWSWKANCWATCHVSYEFLCVHSFFPHFKISLFFFLLLFLYSEQDSFCTTNLLGFVLCL